MYRNGRCEFGKKLFITKHIQLINSYQPVLMYILGQRPNMTADTFCGTVFQGQNCRLFDPDGTIFNWSVYINETNARPANESKTATHSTNSEPLTIVHITDTHSDPLYLPGSLAQCDEYVCCRAGVLVGIANHMKTSQIFNVHFAVGQCDWIK